MGEFFRDDKDEVDGDAAFVESFYLGDAADNCPMERRGAQWTIQIPDYVTVIFTFCALAAHGICF